MELRARIVFDSEETGRRLGELATECGLSVQRSCSIAEADALAALQDIQLLLIDQRATPVDRVAARVYTLASAHPDLLVAVLVPCPRAACDAELFRARAFDVLDDGPELRTNLQHTVAAARRVVALQDERARLHSELAHQDKLSALGILSAGVSHEINNPCSAILSNMSVLRDQLESVMSRGRFQRVDALDRMASDWIEAMGDCISAANRINAIVRTLNVFSRKSESARPTPTNVNDEIRTVNRLIGKEVRFQAQLDLELAPENPHVLAPPNTVTQIITNLVVNALQALEASDVEQPRVTIATEFDDDHVLLSVQDNGPGIPANILDRIFDPFFTTKPTGKGTGLGLSITKELVNKLGGDIFVESAEGLGARFSVVLDRARAVSTTVSGWPRLPPIHERLRVLILDDDELILRSMHRSLSSHFECEAVGAARTALDLLDQDGDFDAVVSDVVMPEMNGLEFWTQLEQKRPELALKTVFISGGITSEKLHAGVSDTGRPCLVKPVDIAELVRTIRRLGRPFEDLHR
jgi:signal transduction histidine kinase/CheY-like chemotaxis protein